MPSSWIYIPLCFFLITLIHIESVNTASTSSSTTVSYTEHCSSIIPQSSPTFRTHKDSIPPLMTSYISGGDRFIVNKARNPNYEYVGRSLNLEILPKYYETVSNDIFKVEALLCIQPVYRHPLGGRRDHSYIGSYSQNSTDPESIRFLLEGFWSEVSRTLCMIGSAFFEVEKGKIINLNAVLKLKYANENNPTIYTSVASGTLESTDSEADPGYFDPFLIFSFPDFPNYNYSLVSKELEGMLSSDLDVPKCQSLSLRSFCPLLAERVTSLALEYAMECKEPHHCTPVNPSEQSTQILPPFLSLYPIQCSEGVRKLRYIAKFQDTSYPDPSFGVDSSMMVEAMWDDKSNQLFGAACRILNPANHLGNALEDCTIRLSLRFPSIWTIRNDAEIVGKFWSTKSVGDFSYFRKINLTASDQIGIMAFLGLRYEYTELDRVRKLCPVKKPMKKGYTFPDGYSHAMRFDLTIKGSKGDECGWGYAKPVSVEYTIFEMISMSEPGIFRSKNALINISYKIRINPSPQINPSCSLPILNLNRQVEITAEGVYNAETGYLCMVGCRKLEPYRMNSNNVSMDCEILVKFEFSPLNDKEGGFIKGTIESTRAKADPLFFDNLSFSSSAFYPEAAERSIWRMDVEIIMVLISNILSGLFVGLQILHCRRNPKSPSSISLVMLLILSLGHMIPLILNFEVQTQSLTSGGKLEGNELTVRMIRMIAFLLQIRLLQLVWTAKQSQEDNANKWWIEERTVFLFYILGGFLTLLYWIRNSYSDYPGFSLWGDLRSYAGLILDSFLLPQILLNLVRDSAEKALSPSFYIGISAVRLVPHGYNQYRAHNYPMFDVKETYYYADPATDFYSNAWDIVIPCGIIALAVSVFMQQRHGGRCVLPQRLRRESEMYEKTPTVDSE